MIGAAIGASAQQKSKPASQKKKKNGNGDKKMVKTKDPAGNNEKENTNAKEKKPTSDLMSEWMKFAKDYISQHKVSSGKSVPELIKEAGEKCCPHVFFVS